MVIRGFRDTGATSVNGPNIFAGPDAFRGSNAFTGPRAGPRPCHFPGGPLNTESSAPTPTGTSAACRANYLPLPQNPVGPNSPLGAAPFQPEGLYREKEAKSVLILTTPMSIRSSRLFSGGSSNIIISSTRKSKDG